MTNIDDSEIEGSKLYTTFTGVLLGFSITFVTLLLTLSGKEIKESPFFGYAIAAFVLSAFSYLETCTGFIHFIRKNQNWAYDLASYFYYVGYLAMILGIVYLLKLFNISLALNIAYGFLILAIFFAIHDGYLTLKDENRALRDVIFFPGLIIGYISTIWFTLINI